MKEQTFVGYTIDFLFTQAAFLLLLTPFIIWCWIFLNHKRNEKLKAFGSSNVLDTLLIKRDPSLFWIKIILYALAWIAAIIALMQPIGNEQYIFTQSSHTLGKKISTTRPQRKKMHEVILLIDASASMSIKDQSGKSRFAVSKEIADQVIRRLKGEYLSLFIFTSATIQIVPSTVDYLFTRLMLQQIEINEGETKGTDIEQALLALRNKYFNTFSSSTKTILLFSDGGDTRLTALPEHQQKAAIDQIISPISDAAKNNLRIHVIGLGSIQGEEVPGILFEGHPVISALNQPLLKKISTITTGDFFNTEEIPSFEIVEMLSKAISQDESFVYIDEPVPEGELSTKKHDDYFQFPLAIAILSLMLCLLLPDTLKWVKERRNP